MEQLSTLTAWLAEHPLWIFAAIAASAFVESLAMLGVVVPGVALLFGIATLAGSADLALANCLVAAMIGAVCGDVVSFFLGRHAHGWALRHWPFRQHPEWIERGERFFQRYGILSVVAGRFIGPLRPVIPFIAGMLSMPPSRFVLINLLSALFWAPVYILPGYLIGSTSQAHPAMPESFWPLFWGLTLITLLGLLLLFLLHRWLQPNQWLYLLLVGSTSRQSGAWERLRSPRSGELPIASLLLLLACSLGLLGLSLIVSQTDWLTGLNHQYLTLVAMLRNPVLDPFFVAITLIGDGQNLLLVALLLAAALVLDRHPRAALFWICGLLLTYLGSTALKHLLAIPRPELLAAPLDSFAFPSTHTAASTTFFALLATAVAQQQPASQRWRVYLITTLPILAIGLSRVYLGVHWVSDVLGGLLLGMATAALTRLAFSRFDRQDLTLSPRVLAALGLSLACTLVYLLWNLDAGLHRYATS